jgi:phosphate transport system protein
MSRLLDKGLEEFTTMILKMGDLADQTVSMSLEGFLRGIDVEEEARLRSEMLDGMSADVEDKAFELIAKYQPVASDLRIIKSYMKIAYDLERYGRYAWDISFTHKLIAKSEKCEHLPIPIGEMVEKTSGMVRTSVRVLRCFDAELAKTLAETEREVDGIYLKCLEHISEAPPATKCMVCDVLVIRYLERIADHATYVGESIIYIATGEKAILR